MSVTNISRLLVPKATEPVHSSRLIIGDHLFMTQINRYFRKSKSCQLISGILTQIWKFPGVYLSIWFRRTVTGNKLFTLPKWGIYMGILRGLYYRKDRIWLSICKQATPQSNISILDSKRSNVRKRTVWQVRPTKIQISLRGLESSLSAYRNFAPLAFQNVPSEDSDQTLRKRRLIWIFAGRKCPQVRFLTLWLIQYLTVRKQRQVVKTDDKVNYYWYTESFTHNGWCHFN